jgi:putative intracellular protease/amidase
MKLLFSIVLSCSILITSAKTHKVLLFVRDGSPQLEFMLINEVDPMKELLEKSGYKVTIATISGETITAGSAKIKPDTKLSLVNINDYAGFIFPCMATGDSINPQAVEFVKTVIEKGKPMAGQLGSVLILAKAGALKGKKFAFTDGKNWNSKMYPEFEDGIFSGTGVVKDENVITSGTCPWMAKMSGKKDCTNELTQGFIAMLNKK